MSDRLTMEALEQHQHDGVPRQRRRSSIKPEGSESTAPGLVGPNFRRMSRIEPRPSIQYGLSGRRPSQASRRTSISGTSQGTKHHVIPVRLQNTYRMHPESKEKFNAGPVEKIMKSVLESYLEGEVYEHKMCANLAQNLSDVIKSRVKDLGFPRYKLVCNVLIGENSSQAVMMTSRCLWNSDTDNFAQARFSKGKLFAIATVFATYFEWPHFLLNPSVQWNSDTFSSINLISLTFFLFIIIYQECDVCDNVITNIINYTDFIFNIL